jgi:hypothetical protein
VTRHDESLLWEYAARELDPEDARLVQHHLTECPDCQEKLSDVRTAQGALKAARSAALEVRYTRVDAALSQVIDRRMQAQAMGRRWVLALSGALVAVGVGLVVFGLWPKAAPVEVPVAPVAVEAPRVVPVVENAEALTRVGVTSEVMQKGSGLETGDVLKTAAHGKATLKLPEGTRLAMTGDTQLALTRVQKDEVALTLERGHVAVAASHARRKGFVLHANGLMVTVVGTAFSVTSSHDAVEVAVADGRVSVETPEGLPQFVNAGQRVQFETRHWRSSRGALPAAEKKELAALTLSVADVPAPAVVVPSSGGVPSKTEELPPLPVARRTMSASAPQLQLVASTVGEIAPRPVAEAPVAATPEVAPAPAVEPPVAPAPQPMPEPAPVAASKPDMSGLEVPLLASPVESVGRPPEQREWAEMPKASPQPPPAAPTTAAPSEPVAAAQVPRRHPTYAPSFDPPPAPPPASKLSRTDELPTDAETLFLQRAERSLFNGTCERFLQGLGEVANDARKTERSERARVFRARCYDAMMKPQQAYQEYRRYLQQYPNGRFVEEARQVMDEMQ